MLMALALIAKLLIYIGALVAIGILSHFFLAIRPNLKGLRMALTVMLAGAFSKLFIANAQLSGQLSGAFNPDTWGWVWMSNGTQFLVFTSGAAIGLFASFINTINLKKATALISVFILSVGFAVSGHTQAAETLPLLPLWIVPHTLIAGYWIWAPVTLWPKDTDADDNIALKADRFSRIAIWAVPFLFVSGLYLFWRLNGSFWNSGTTLYGRLLLGKLAAALLLLGLGAYNKFRIAGLLHRDPQKGRAALRLSLRGEAVLFSVVILCVLFATTVTGPEGHHH